LSYTRLVTQGRILISRVHADGSEKMPFCWRIQALKVTIKIP